MSGRARRLRAVAADLFALGAIAALLVAVFSLVPPDVQARFAFRNDLSDPVSALTAAYLHIDRPHLTGNLVGYAVAAGATHLLCLRLGARRWFWLTTATFLIALPVSVNLTSSAVLSAVLGTTRLPPGRGFSGVVAGFGGFLFVALLASLRRRYGRLTVVYAGLLVVLVLLGELLVIYLPWPPVTGGALLIAGVTIGLVGLSRQSRRRRPRDRDDWLRALVGVLLALQVLAVLVVLVYGLFPARIVEGGTFTNVVAHAAGFVYGALLAGWGHRYWTPPSTETIRMRG